MYTSELARHQHRVVFLRYNLDLSSVFGVVNTPVYNHAKPNKVVFSPLTNRRCALAVRYGLIVGCGYDIIRGMDTKEFDDFVLENFGGVVRDNPWEKEPEFTVFRHGDNRKWIALRFCATREQLLKLKPDDEIVRSYMDGALIDMINIKIDPEMVGDVTKMPGFLPAFHMSRRHWITIILDKDVDINKMKPLVEMSYNLTGKKYHSGSKN